MSFTDTDEQVIQSLVKHYMYRRPQLRRDIERRKIAGFEFDLQAEALRRIEQKRNENK